MKIQLLIYTALVLLTSNNMVSAADPEPKPESTFLVSARNGGLLALGGLGLASLYKTGLLSQIQSHMQKNKLVTCVITVAGAYGLYRHFCISASPASESPISIVHGATGKERYHGMLIPGLKHLAVSGGPSHYVGRGEPSSLDDLIEWDSCLDLNAKEFYTKKTFKDLILAEEAAHKRPYLLVRIAFFDKNIIKYGYRCSSGDVPYYSYRDAEKYNSEAFMTSNSSKPKRLPTEILYIKIEHKDGQFIATTFEESELDSDGSDDEEEEQKEDQSK
jgi:hypothetical protein